MKISRGTLYTADLNPHHGTEPGKVRPVLVIQTDFINNTLHPSTIVLLLTSQVRPEAEILRFHLRKGESGLTQDSDIMLDQIRAIDNSRFRKEIGRLSLSKLRSVEQRIRIVLSLDEASPP